MSYSILKDYALLSVQNLHAAFATGLLSAEEAKSDLIWVQNKDLVFDAIQQGWFVALYEEVGTEFWQKWISSNFLQFVSTWSKASGQRSLLHHSYNSVQVDVTAYAQEGEEVVKNLREMLFFALDSVELSPGEVSRLRVLSQLFKLGESEFYQNIASRKLSQDDFFLLITQGSSFFRFDKYYEAKQKEKQRIDLIYAMCYFVVGKRDPKVEFSPKGQTHVAVTDVPAYTFKLHALKDWIKNTGSKIDGYLFDVVFKTFVFGNLGTNRSEVLFSFNWFILSTSKLNSQLDHNQILSLFNEIVQKEITPIDTVIEQFSAISSNYRTGMLQNFASTILAKKYTDYHGSEIEKLKAIAGTMDTLNTWTDTSHLLDFTKTTFEDFCNWAAERYSNPKHSDQINAELSKIGASFSMTFEKLPGLLAFLKNVPKRLQATYINILGVSLKMSHPFLKNGWLTGSFLDLSSPTGLNVNHCWTQARQWIASNVGVKNSSAFLNSVQDSSSSFKTKDALECLQKNVFFAYIGSTFCTEPHRVVIEDDAPKKGKTGLIFNPEFLKEALTIAKSVKGGFDAKKYLPTQFAMTYFASKRKGKNLFSRYDTNLVYNGYTSLQYDKNGLPGLEVADPFEKGFSWGNYEKIAKLCRVTDYTSNSTYETRAKRFAVYLLSHFVAGEPDAVNAKLAQTEAKSLSRVVCKIASALGSAQTRDTIIDNFQILRERKADIVAYFADKTQHLGNLVGVCKMLIDTGKFMNPTLLPFAELFTSLTNNNITEESIEKYQNYMAIALKNKVSMSYVMRAIRHADQFDAHNVKGVPEKVIKAEPVNLVEQGVKAKILDNGDLRALTIGLEISCCQYIDGYASTCAVATYEDANYGIVLVENTDSSKGTRPLAESAIWISDKMVIIDSIEGLRKDAAGYTKIAAAFNELIKQWHAQGLRVGISTTDYGLTVQISNKLRREFGYAVTSVSTPARPLRNIYTDVGNHVYELKKV